MRFITLTLSKSGTPLSIAADAVVSLYPDHVNHRSCTTVTSSNDRTYYVRETVEEVMALLQPPAPAPGQITDMDRAAIVAGLVHLAAGIDDGLRLGDDVKKLLTGNGKHPRQSTLNMNMLADEIARGDKL